MIHVVVVKTTSRWRGVLGDQRSFLNTQLCSDHFKDGTSEQIIYVHLRSPLCLTKISNPEGAVPLQQYTCLLTQAYKVIALQEKSRKGNVGRASTHFPL